MTGTVTTKEFKSTHQLSDSAFQRLVAKIIEQSCSESDVPLTRDELLKREGSHDWLIVRLDLFNDAVADRKPRRNSAIVTASTSLPVVQSTREFLSAVQFDEIPISPTFKHVDSGDRVTAIDGGLSALLTQSTQQKNSVIQELLLQAAADGDEIGALIAKVKIAAAQRKENQMIAEFAKKQGLQESETTA